MMKVIQQMNLKKMGKAFLNIFLLAFMVLIFGPSEIFFANVAEFEFVYGEFAGNLAIAAVGVALLLSIILTILPDICYKIVMSVIFGLSVAGYAQVMFLNQRLDLLGLNPDGYHVDIGFALGNLSIWIGIIFVVLALAFRDGKTWDSIIRYVPMFLLGVQVIALVSLLLTAKEEAFHYKTGELYISGEKQYTVSADENVILIVLDYFSNQDMLTVQSQFPDVMDCLHDFTFYNNADCNYYGTFPSLPHMLTGKKFDAGKPLNDWCRDIWTDPDTISFYQQLKDNGYEVNVYTPDTQHLCGSNETELLQACFSNIEDTARNRDVFYKKLFKTMTKMSLYRFSPEILKNAFYTDGSEYGDIVSYEQNAVAHNDDDFYRGLLENGITTDSASKYFIVQHLLGIHEYTVTHKCEPIEWTTLEETTRGCMVMVEEYLNQLKKAGVYDDATIIVTSDHGDKEDSQVIFYVKHPGETHSRSPETNAPISLHELRPTLAQAAGLDAAGFGQTIYEFAEDEQRERQVWVRDYNDNYKDVYSYEEQRTSLYNIYKVYTYTGDYSDLLQKIEQDEYEIVPMTDSYF